MLAGHRTSRNGRPDVRFCRAKPGRLERARPTGRESWFVHRQLADGARYLRWAGLFEFLISADGRRVEYRKLRGATLESFSTYLLGQILSFSLIARGAEPLHGTVVALDGRAVGFLGGCGQGKSTLGAAMLQCGGRLVTDDLVALTLGGGSYLVQPGPARIKLFPAVARALIGHKEAAARLNSGTRKLILPLAGSEVMSRPVPLAALYVLSRSRESRKVSIQSLPPSDRLLEIVAGSFNSMVLERERLKRQFEFAAQLSARVPIKRLRYPSRLASLPAVCEAVAADLRALPVR
nr:hypothetical protein Hi04_10k_c554_00007 [uncultured bacterium]